MSDYHTMIPDFGLTANQLEEKYNPTPDCDRVHPCPDLHIVAWYQEVAFRNTILGYWSWVAMKLSEAERELDRDNPYNQSWGES